MNTYCVFKNCNDNDDLRISRVGFSFWALLTGPIWGVFSKLWVFSFLSFFLIFFSIFLSFWFENLEGYYYIVLIITNLFWGIFARDMYMQQLIKEDYSPLRFITANSKKNAMLIFLSERK